MLRTSVGPIRLDCFVAGFCVSFFVTPLYLLSLALLGFLDVGEVGGVFLGGTLPCFGQHRRQRTSYAKRFFNPAWSKTAVGG